MDDLLHKLERRIKKLLDQYHLLKYSNDQLNQSKNELSIEKELLLVKQLQSITQIESLVSKLKAAENLR